MDIVKNLKVPTGNILIIQGEKGLLECLSLADYGQEKNIKADFMGLSREINGVPHGQLLPLADKWVITISSQYGCQMTCKFCDVPKVGNGRNATFKDLLGQVFSVLSIHPEVSQSRRINLHYARMGEPSLNWEVINSAQYLAGYFKARHFGFHPVVSTMMPYIHTDMREFLVAWMHIKNNILDGNAGLQISINSTDESARQVLFDSKAMTLPEIARHLNFMEVKGRKIALNFALSEYPVEGSVLSKYFDPEKFMCKITPMHMTDACVDNQLKTEEGYTKYTPYKPVEEDLKKHGYDVIVFIPSKEEDESRITCGNAILASGV